MSVLEVSGLTKCYGQRFAVKDLSLTVQQGQIFGFLGPNGSGKSTTIGMIFGVIRPTRGAISLFGASNREALAQGRLSGTLEQANLLPHLTGRDNLQVAATIKGVDEKLIEPALQAVDMAKSADREVMTYSLGMRQRLALAAAMLGDPELLVLDEPTNGLDPEGMREIRELLVHLSRSGRTIFISTHLLDEVEKICTHVAILKLGRLQYSGAVTELTGRKITFKICAEDTCRLLEAVRRYEFARNARRMGDAVHLELIGDGPAALSRYLARSGIYLTELRGERQTLEEAFLEVTSREITAEMRDEA